MSRWMVAATGIAAVFGATVQAQDPMTGAMQLPKTDAGASWTLGAQAIAVVTRASPAHANRSLTEGYLTQPMILATLSAFGGLAGVNGMLDFEGITLDRGELNAGIYGEGYVDRRHPHTYLHELVASAGGEIARTEFSLALGKGFVPFGTDDPMVRPLEKYPVNHHIAQIVERLLATVAVRHGSVLLEAARFNGDEPESPSDWPNRSRLWDSWASRATISANAELDLQASVARVKSPEQPTGGGLDQRKVNVSLRFESSPVNDMPMGSGGMMRSDAGFKSARLDQWQQYGLLEWGRSFDYDGRTRVFSFSTALAEAEVRHLGVALAVRLERTERPEEERLANPFRTPRPATDLSISGRTRWDVVSARLSAIVHESRLGTVTPFVEVQRQHATALGSGAGFDPRTFYGSDRMWGVSAGVGFTAGMIHRRTGQYGATAKRTDGTSMPGMGMSGTGSGGAVSEQR